MKKISIIVPCLNEEEALPVYYEKMSAVMDGMPEVEFELLFVDDGSTDGTLGVMRKLCERDGRCCFLSFSRNFGKEAAIYAGLKHVTGDFAAVMDADLQDPPELLPQMYRIAAEEGYECVAAKRSTRTGEPRIRSFLSEKFYDLVNRISKIRFESGARDYRLMKRKVVKAIVAMSERERFTKGIYAWVGFKNKWIEYENVERIAGKTKWNIRGLFHYAYSGFLAFATTPLRAVIYFGMFIVMASVIYAGYIFVGTLNSDAERTGYASIIIIMLFLGGVIITILGMIGEYMARIYMEVKNRPIYFVRESNISENEQNETSNIP